MVLLETDELSRALSRDDTLMLTRQAISCSSCRLFDTSILVGVLVGNVLYCAKCSICHGIC